MFRRTWDYLWNSAYLFLRAVLGYLWVCVCTFVISLVAILLYRAYLYLVH